MFIKKRKITKASIEELAKRYPQDIISDEDARNIIGGAYFTLLQGRFLESGINVYLLMTYE